MISRILAVAFAICVGACAVQTSSGDEADNAPKGEALTGAAASPEAKTVDEAKPATVDALTAREALDAHNQRCQQQPQPWQCGGPLPTIERRLQAEDLGAAAADEHAPTTEPLIIEAH